MGEAEDEPRQGASRCVSILFQPGARRAVRLAQMPRPDR